MNGFTNAPAVICSFRTCLLSVYRRSLQRQCCNRTFSQMLCYLSSRDSEVAIDRWFIATPMEMDVNASTKLTMLRFSHSCLWWLQLCGASIFGLGIYMSTTSKYMSIFPSLSVVNLASVVFVIGIFVTCVSFLGFLGALKENRCLLISVSLNATPNEDQSQRSVSKKFLWVASFQIMC